MVVRVITHCISLQLIGPGLHFYQGWIRLVVLVHNIIMIVITKKIIVDL